MPYKRPTRLSDYALVKKPNIEQAANISLGASFGTPAFSFEGENPSDDETVPARQP
jgi:hypothetical protein